jgi:hypothetical protein
MLQKTICKLKEAVLARGRGQEEQIVRGFRTLPNAYALQLTAYGVHTTHQIPKNLEKPHPVRSGHPSPC